MRKKLRLSMTVFLGIFLFLMGGMVTVQAAQYYCVMDEYGPGYWKDVSLTNDTWHVWNGALSSDPWTGGNSLLYIGYNRPFTGYFDILVKDPTGANSDMLRFSNNINYPDYTFIRFYSADTSGGAPADTGLPTTRNVIATVYENADGIFNWTDGFGDQFEGRSSVPEPATMLLLGFGLMGLAGVKRKFKK